MSDFLPVDVYASYESGVLLFFFQKTDDGWREVLIEIDEQNKLHYRISGTETASVRNLIRPPLDSGDRTELEISARSLGIARQLSDRVDQDGGIALIADYGHEGEKGDTFRVSIAKPKEGIDKRKRKDIL